MAEVWYSGGDAPSRMVRQCGGSYGESGSHGEEEAGGAQLRGTFRASRALPVKLELSPGLEECGIQDPAHASRGDMSGSY
jgi:hypothetical protein